MNIDLIKHARPSSAQRWLNCTAFPSLNEANALYNLLTSSAATEGSKKHEIARIILTVTDYLNSEKGNFEDISDDIRVYIKHIAELIYHYEDDSTYGIEEELFYTPSGYSELYTLKGTPDFYIFDKNKLTVVDFKTGFVPVSPINNYQLMFYALFLFPKIRKEYPTLDLDTYRVENVIVQPNCGINPENQIKEYSYPLSELFPLNERIKDSLTEMLGNNPTYKKGDWCRFCNVKSKCPLYLETMLEARVASKIPIDEAFKKNNAIDLERISDWLKYKKPIIGWLNSLEKMAYAMIENGIEIPDFFLKEMRGNASLNDSVGLQNAINEKYPSLNINIFKGKEETAMSLTSIRKNFHDNKMDLSLLEDFIVYKNPRMSLINENLEN